VAALYGKSEVTEQYGTCNYGPNAEFWPALLQGGLRITGADADGNARIVEIDQHPFYTGTLFQPERSAFVPVVHPLIRGLVQTARETHAAPTREDGASRRAR
jgi:CTP synthase (UTP-ammonia lyase)